MKKFKVGGVVYVTTCGQRFIKITCPVCFGKLEVTLILGDDSRVLLPCKYCAPGFEPPRGVVDEYVAGARVDTRIITSMDTTESDVETHRYNCSGYISDDTNTFATQEEADEHAAKLAKEEQKRLTTQAEYLKKENHKSYSWNAGYHRRTAKKHRKDAEYHDEMAVLCKERAK